jgi:hypothetical protein
MVSRAINVAVLQRTVGRGPVTTVETFARPAKPLLYEAAYKDSKGQRHEVLVHGGGKDVEDRRLCAALPVSSPGSVLFARAEPSSLLADHKHGK